MGIDTRGGIALPKCPSRVVKGEGNRKVQRRFVIETYCLWTIFVMVREYRFDNIKASFLACGGFELPMPSAVRNEPLSTSALFSRSDMNYVMPSANCAANNTLVEEMGLPRENTRTTANSARGFHMQKSGRQLDRPEPQGWTAGSTHIIVASAIQFQCVPPEKFDFRAPLEWSKRRRRFRRFRTASGLFKKSDEAQVNMLLYCIGPKADDMMDSFTLKEDQVKKYATVKDSEQKPRLQTSSGFSNTGNNMGNQQMCLLTTFLNWQRLEGLITTVLVIGVSDDRLSEVLQINSGLTMEQAIKNIRQVETVKQ
ncbi:hypothetical protein PR048_026241 [Dryococelus australis]|uniref:Uncharacterized protein n=1 Tax=Dryococelus australis TaxID=614101 RepID=A0ABQ9GKV8_9NEOP|nr:hypothetical protein PR048_026241 [Dryococelus australis]